MNPDIELKRFCFSSWSQIQLNINTFLLFWLILIVNLMDGTQMCLSLFIKTSESLSSFWFFLNLALIPIYKTVASFFPF